MKRASLAALPAGPTSNKSADLTDRLLEREARAGLEQPIPAQGAEAPARPRRRRQAAAASDAPEAAAAIATTETAIAPAEPGTGESASITVEQALRQADAAAQALRQAARTTPARFEVAQGYRLDALAHHIQQVAEFFASLARS